MVEELWAQCPERLSALDHPLKLFRQPSNTHAQVGMVQRSRALRNGNYIGI
jgi:hypothetical protein